MPALIIKRESGTALLRSLRICVNGKVKSRIKEGETLSFNLEDGNHTICVSLDNFKSKEKTISINGEEIIHMRIGAQTYVPPQDLVDHLMGALRIFRKRYRDKYLYLEEVSLEEVQSDSDLFEEEEYKYLLHGVLDLIMVGLLFLAPALFEFNRLTTNIFIALAIIQILLVFFSKYPFGQIKKIPMAMHKKTEGANSVILTVLLLSQSSDISSALGLGIFAVLFFALSFLIPLRTKEELQKP